ncbi:MAG: T9SS type A sorting domain-containing protein [Bacteroidia bacterium]
MGADLNVNKVNALIINSGDQFWDLISNPRYEVPAGSGLHANFANALWIGGMDETGQLHVSGATYRQSGDDYFLGPFHPAGQDTCDLPFSTITDCLQDGLLWLSSDKMLAVRPRAIEVYDPQTQTKIVRSYSTDFNSIVAEELANGNVLLLGWKLGSADPSHVIVLDSAGFTISRFDTLNTAFSNYPTLVELPNGKVLIMGHLSSEEYDPATGQHVAKANMSIPRSKAAAAVLPNGKVLLVGGSSLTAELYDPTLNTWTVRAGMSISRPYAPRLLLLPNGNVWITGGFPLAGGEFTDFYDPIADTITAGPTLPEPAAGHLVALTGAQEALIVGNENFNSRPYSFNFVTGAYRYYNPLKAGLPAAYKNGRLCFGFNRSMNQFAFFSLATNVMEGMPWQKVWKVTRKDVQQFQQDFGSQSVDFTRYPDIQSWPGNGNISAGEDAQLAPYVDIDQDGVYDPAGDGDYPCIPGDAALWWVFNDNGVHTGSGGEAFPLQVEAMAYAVDCDQTPCPDSSLDYATFYHYEISNRSTHSFDSLRIGFWREMDLGNYADDYIGSDSALGLAFVYNGDANDESDRGYGMNPPALGSLVLPGAGIQQMTGMIYHENAFGTMGNPIAAHDYYNYLGNFWMDSTHMVNNGQDGYHGSGPGPITNYAFSGNAGWCSPGDQQGWSELSAGNQPFDRKMIQEYGPVQFPVGGTATLDVALVFSRANYNDNLGSVCKLKTDAVAVRSWWQNTLDKSCLSILAGRGEAQLAAKLGLFPNPTSGVVSLRLDKPTRKELAMQVLDLQGRNVWNGRISNGQSEAQLDLQHLPAGIYIVLVEGIGAQRLAIER